MYQLDIRNFIEKHQGDDFFTIYEVLVSEMNRLDGLRVKTNRKNNLDEWQLNNYRNHIGDFLFFLNTGMIPATIGKSGLELFRPIINSLVEKKQLREEALEVLD